MEHRQEVTELHHQQNHRAVTKAVLLREVAAVVAVTAAAVAVQVAAVAV